MASRFERVSKLEAARRQLEEAIEVFFRQGDMVAVHTLAAAALDILRDLGRPKGLGSIVKDSPLVLPEKQREVREIFNAAQNFFKHANRDPEETLEFRPDATPFFIFDAIELYAQVKGSSFAAGDVFRMWFVVTNPQFTLGPLRSLVDDAKRAGIDPDNFEGVRLALAHWKSRNPIA